MQHEQAITTPRQLSLVADLKEKMMFKRSFLAGIATVAVAGIAACGGSSGSPPQTGATANTPSVATTTAQERVASPVTSGSPSQASSAAPSPAAVQATRLNLNTATAEQFKTIPGVGDRFVREFMEYRPYTTIGQFRRELGKYVSQDQVTQWEQYLFVPIDPNRADAETLRQIAGVGASIAAQIVSARPYASTDAFLTKLGQYVSADQVAAARGYLATT